MQLISRFNKEFRFLLCVTDIYSKYAWVIPLKDKKGIIFTNAFQKTLNESNRKPNKIWAGKGSEFHNKSMKSWLERNDIEMYSTHSEDKSVVAERFIRTLINKTYKYMTSVSKNVCVDKLDDIANEYNNTYDNTIYIKPVDIKSNKCVNSSKEVTDKNPTFKIYDNVRISKYKKVFPKAIIQIGQKKFLWLKKLKPLCQIHILLVILQEKKLLKRFMKTNCKKQ